MQTMTTFVVVPCLNEELTLPSTCASLGFGYRKQHPDDTVLVLVDNGSSDETREQMSRIAGESEANSVLLGLEPVRGYAPPRRRGVQLALDHALAQTNSLESSLVIQADADTIYQPGYVEQLREAAMSYRNALFHGRTVLPSDFRNAHSAYAELSYRADVQVDRLCVAENEQVIVDDKVCAYWLGDYLAWGGHTQEFDQCGDEIHAETTRMFMRAKTLGGRLRHVDGAIAEPSRRKVLVEPALHYSTDGFPRGSHWSDKWRDAYGIDTFDRILTEPAVMKNTTALRQAHEIILFGALPCAVGRAIGQVIPSHDSLLAPLIALLPSPKAQDLFHNPGRVLSAALDVVDTRLPEIGDFISKQTSA